MTATGERVSLAKLRIDHWDRISRTRALEDWETDELAWALRQDRNDERKALVRAQAASPPPGKRSRRADPR